MIKFAYLEGGQQFHTFLLVRDLDFGSRLRLWLYGSTSTPLLVLDSDATTVPVAFLGNLSQAAFAVSGLGGGAWSISGAATGVVQPGTNLIELFGITIRGDLQNGIVSVNQYQSPPVSSPPPGSADLVISEDFNNVQLRIPAPTNGYRATNRIVVHGRGAIFQGATQWRINRGEFVNEGVDAYGENLQWLFWDNDEDGPTIRTATPVASFANPVQPPIYDTSIADTPPTEDYGPKEAFGLYGELSSSWVSSWGRLVANVRRYGQLTGSTLYLAPYEASLISGGPYTLDIPSGAYSLVTDGDPGYQPGADIPNNQLIINSLPSGISKSDILSFVVHPT